MPGMPAYRALTDINEVGAEPDLRRFWHRDVKKGDVIHVLQWPTALFAKAGEFEAANLEAEAVVEYFDAAYDHPKLLESPWDWYLRAIFLPELPGIKAGKVEYVRVPEKAAA